MITENTLLQFFGRLHPALLHLPIGLWIGIAVLEFGAALFRRRASRAAIATLSWVAAIGGAISATAGWYLAMEDGYGGRLLEQHRWFGLAAGATGLLAAAFAGLRARRPFRLLLALEIGALMTAGHFGSQLTHGSNWLMEPFEPPDAEAPGDRTDPGTQAPATTDPGQTEPRSTDPRDPHAADPAASDGPTFATVILPILERRCAKCHGESKQKGELALHTREGIERGGEYGPVLVAGDPATSEMLIRMLLPEDDEDHMPPEGKPQPTAAELKMLRGWIVAGAPFDGPFDPDAEPAAPADPDARPGTPSTDVPSAPINGGQETGHEPTERAATGEPEPVPAPADPDGAASTPTGAGTGATPAGSGQVPVPVPVVPPPTDPKEVPKPDGGTPPISDPAPEPAPEPAPTKEPAKDPGGGTGEDPPATNGTHAVPVLAPVVTREAAPLPADDARLRLGLEALQRRLVHAELIGAGSGLWVDFAPVAASMTAAEARTLLQPVADRVQDLGLWRMPIGDDFVPVLARMPLLERADLRATRVTGKGLQQLRGHPRLARLVVAETRLDDGAVEPLLAMPALRRVWVWNSGLSAAAIARLRARDGLTVDAGEPGADPVVEVEPEPVFSTPAPHAATETPTDAPLDSPAEPAAEVATDPAADPLRPVNATCPVSGRPIDPRYVIVHERHAVGFCCPRCPGTFWADPHAYPVAPR